MRGNGNTSYGMFCVLPQVSGRLVARAGTATSDRKDAEYRRDAGGDQDERDHDVACAARMTVCVEFRAYATPSFARRERMRLSAAGALKANAGNSLEMVTPASQYKRGCLAASVRPSPTRPRSSFCQIGTCRRMLHGCFGVPAGTRQRQPWAHCSRQPHFNHAPAG